MSNLYEILRLDKDHFVGTPLLHESATLAEEEALAVMENPFLKEAYDSYLALQTRSQTWKEHIRAACLTLKQELLNERNCHECIDLRCVWYPFEQAGSQMAACPGYCLACRGPYRTNHRIIDNRRWFRYFS
jgi:hypothetical protein